MNNERLPTPVSIVLDTQERHYQRKERLERLRKDIAKAEEELLVLKRTFDSLVADLAREAVWLDKECEYEEGDGDSYYRHLPDSVQRAHTYQGAINLLLEEEMKERGE